MKRRFESRKRRRSSAKYGGDGLDYSLSTFIKEPHANKMISYMRGSITAYSDALTLRMIRINYDREKIDRYYRLMDHHHQY